MLSVRKSMRSSKIILVSLLIAARLSAHSFDASCMMQTMMQLPINAVVDYFESQVALLCSQEEYLLSSKVIEQTLYHVEHIYDVCTAMYVDNAADRLNRSPLGLNIKFTDYLQQQDNHSFEQLCVLFCNTLSRMLIPLMQALYDNPTSKELSDRVAYVVHTFEKVIHNLRNTPYEQRYVFQLQRYLELKHMITFTMNARSS